MPLPQFLLYLARLLVRERVAPAGQRAKQKKDERFFGHNHRFAVSGNDRFSAYYSNFSAATP